MHILTQSKTHPKSSSTCRGAMWETARSFAHPVDQHRPLIRLEKPQRGGENPYLPCCISGFTHRTSEGKGDPEGPGRPDAYRVLPDQTDLSCGQALFLQVVPQRAHGVRAVRSRGDKDNGASTPSALIAWAAWRAWGSMARGSVAFMKE